jgi:hypothetical protein
LHFFIVIADGAEQEGAVGVAGDKRGAGIAAFENGSAGIETKVAFKLLRFRRVAFVAVLDEDGPNLLFEEGDIGGAAWAGEAGEEQTGNEDCALEHAIRRLYFTTRRTPPLLFNIKRKGPENGEVSGPLLFVDRQWISDKTR